MKLRLGRKADYSVRAILVLARAYGDGRRKVRQIARVMDIPDRYLPQVMAPLVRSGLVHATAGPDGGYELTRRPREVSLLEVIEIAEGPLEGDRCVLEGGPCDWEHECPVHDAWSRSYRILARELGRTNFEDLAKRDAALEAGTLEPPTEPTHPVAVERNGIRD